MNKIFKPFVSIDIETSGLVACEPYILEIGAHFEDFGYFNKRESSKNKFNVKIDNGILKSEKCQKVAMEINEQLLGMIRDKDESDGAPVVTLEVAKKLFREWLYELHELVKKEKLLCNNPEYFKLTPAGKNFGSFDSLIFNQWQFGLDDYISHRVLDPGPLYYLDFGFVPNLDQIQELRGLGKVKHMALDDALAVSGSIVAKVSGKL